MNKQPIFLEQWVFLSRTVFCKHSVPPCLLSYGFLSLCLNYSSPCSGRRRCTACLRNTNRTEVHLLYSTTTGQKLDRVLWKFLTTRETVDTSVESVANKKAQHLQGLFLPNSILSALLWLYKYFVSKSPVDVKYQNLLLEWQWENISVVSLISIQWSRKNRFLNICCQCMCIYRCLFCWWIFAWVIALSCCSFYIPNILHNLKALYLALMTRQKKTPNV